jgi:hypothetical protein
VVRDLPPPSIAPISQRIGSGLTLDNKST